MDPQSAAPVWPLQVSAPTHERLSALVLSPCGRLVLSGGTNGVVTLRWVHSLQVGT